MTTDDGGCELLGNFGYIIQGILGVMSFAVLVYKRFSENPKRTWKVWFFDSSKQLSSAGMAHIMNVIIAIFLSEQSDNGDSCVWYFINIFIDSTLGMLICLLFLSILNKLAEANNWRSMQSGLYFEFYVKDGKLRNRLKISMYAYQLLSWLGIVVVSKIILALIQLSINGFLEDFGTTILWPFKNVPKLKLIIVMIFIPVIMNSIQFWVQDNFLKLKKEVYPQLEMPQSNQLQYELPDLVLDGPGKEDHNNPHSNQEIRIDFNEDQEKKIDQDRENHLEDKVKDTHYKKKSAEFLG
eukprot:CAMPEP_0170517020 /NCGR_PEP_ID=MMETSP0209-20121228/3119_1 /TAXON_ID=665100 ORGANISM="Litonotus pictus, Strain P1" /NCGR_SAMPLE_ID=MMETSP0209 /ASSEMBLY_ACC=CAM_ASM_000301 /LENGTH=295 /DNA_ID=CAMNT_0010802153 /DNA_START=407 /DNA_END=1294 /DNA_ORIENTATION=-